MNRKHGLILTASLLLTASCSSNTAPVGDIVLDGDFQDSFELTDRALYFPTAHLENDGEVTSYDVKYTVKNIETKESETSKYSSFKLGVGVYSLTYEVGGKTLKKTFSVVDTTSPTITFSGIPTDLYIQDIKDLKRANLPSVGIKDLSGYDEDSVKKTLTLEGREIAFNDVMETYAVTDYGKYEYTVTVSDEYGNRSTAKAAWTIKDKEYNPSSVQSGYLADFSDNGYTNLISTSSINEYYRISTLHDEYLSAKSDEYDEIRAGVFKISGGFNRNNGTGNNASFKIKLPEQSTFTYEQLKGRYLAMDVLLENEGSTDMVPSVTLLGNIAESDGNLMKTLTLNKNVQIGKWQTIYIDAYNAARLGLFDGSTHDNGADATFPGGDSSYYNTISGSVSSLSFGLVDQSNDSHNEGFSFYIDSIRIADRVMDRPQLKEENGLIGWNAVENALCYEVNVDGEVHETTSTSISVPDGRGYVKVRAITNGHDSISSQESVVLYGYGQTDYDFDDDNYSSLLIDTLRFNETDDFENSNYRYKTMSVSNKDDGMHLNLSSSNWAIVNGFSLALPHAARVGEYDTLKISLKVSTDSLKTLSLYTDGRSKGNQIKKIDLTNKANQTIDVDIDLSTLTSDFDYLDFVFGIGASTKAMEVVIENMQFIKVKKLNAPEILVSGNDVFWEGVDNATGYEITEVINGVSETKTVTDTEYTAGSDVSELVIKAVDSTGVYADSQSVYLVRDGDSMHFAYYVDDTNLNGGYSTDSLIQISGIDLPGNLADTELTAQFDLTNLKVMKNGEESALESLHYHNNITPKLFQPHFSGLASGDTVVIKGGLCGSYFSCESGSAIGRSYYILSDDIVITHNGERLVLA